MRIMIPICVIILLIYSVLLSSKDGKVDFSGEWNDDGKSLTINTVFTFSRDGEEITIKTEGTWSLENGDLVIDSIRSSPRGERKSKRVYEKADVKG